MLRLCAAMPLTLQKPPELSMFNITAERRYKSRACAVLIALTLAFVLLFGGTVPARAETDGMVRVRLTRLGAPDAVTLKADCDYYLASDPTVRIRAGERMTVSAVGEVLTLSVGSKRAALGATARLMRDGSGNAGIQFIQPELSNRFSGDLGLSASGGVVSAVLNIYIENYLYGVVGCEMPPSSGIEALKAQAVAARNYALRKKATRSDAAYDLTDTTADQVFRGYSGSSDYANVVKAVDATRGVVLYSGDSLAQCYYSASNGGQTESSRNAWGTALSYSVVQDDPYDLAGAGAVKSATINKDLTGLNENLKQALIGDMTAQLAAQGMTADSAGIQVNGIESITACDSRFAAPSRVYKSLTFRLSVTGTDASGERRTGSMSVSIPTFGAFEDWYDLSINAEDNETVWVDETERAFTVSFRRQGHGVGMSQRGAQVMAAERGMSAAEILSFYYPGTSARRLSLSATSAAAKAAPEPDREAIATARLSDRTDLLDAPEPGAAASATAAAGAVVEVYGVQGDWAAVGSSGKYGFIPADRLESFALKDGDVVRPEGEAYAVATRDAQVLQLPVKGASALGVLPEGDRVQVFAWTDRWAMVAGESGFTGFVETGALRLVQAEVEAEPEAPVDEEPDDADGDVVEAPADLYGQLRQDSPLYAADNELANEIDTLYQGSLVKVLAYNDAWARVRTQEGQTGYLPLACVQALDSAQLKADAQAQVEGGEIRKVRGTRYLYVRADGTKVYGSWSADSGVIGTLNAGDRVRVGAYNERWACVRLPGGDANGYVLRAALTDAAPEADGGGPVARAESGTTAVAVRKGAPVYRSYSESSERIAELDLGERVEVGAFSAVWALVRLDGLTGYVRVSDLKLERPDAAATVPEGMAAESCDARVRAKASLFSRASARSRVLARIPAGATVRVGAWGGGYAYVSYDGKVGFVKLKYLDRIQ